MIEKSKTDACLSGLDACYVDLSKIGDIDLPSLEIPQKEFYKHLKEGSLMDELKEMIIQSKKKSGVNRLDAVCVCGSTVRVAPIREVIDAAANEMGTRTMYVKLKGITSRDVLNVDESVCQGLVYKMKSRADASQKDSYAMYECQVADVMDGSQINLNVPPKIRDELRWHWKVGNEQDDKSKEKYDAIIMEKKEILKKRMDTIREYNKELDEVKSIIIE